MKIVQLDRQEGKTTAAIDWLRADEGRVLLVTNRHMAHVLKRTHADLDRRIFAATDLINEGLRLFQSRPGVTEVGIDELESVLEAVFGQKVTFATSDRNRGTRIESPVIEQSMFPEEVPDRPFVPYPYGSGMLNR